MAADTPLQFQQGSAEWHSYRERAKNDLFFLSGFVLGYSGIFPFEVETHLLPVRFLERKTGVPEIDNSLYQLALWPRRTGKSSIGTVARAIQWSLQDPNAAILIAAVKAGLAEDFLKTIRQHWQSNVLLRSLFPELVPPNFRETEWNNQRATLVRTTMRPEPTYDTIGAGGSVTGKHYDRIIVDDLIDDDVAQSIKIGTYTVLNEMNFWVTTLRPLLSHQPHRCINFLGTRWWVGDTYDHIIKTFGHDEAPTTKRLKMKLPTGKHVYREVEIRGDIAIMKIAGLEEGVAQFPKIWSPNEMQQYRIEHPELFAAHVMNDPSDADVRTFQDSWLHYWQALDPRLLRYVLDNGTSRAVFRDDLHKIMVCDPAFTASGQGARAAIVVTGTDRETGKHLVLDVFADRIEPKTLVEEILHRVKQHKVSRVYLEVVAQQLGFFQFVQAEALRQNLPIMLEEVRPGGRNKDIRIESLAPYFKSGQLYVHAGQHALLEEYRQYKPGAVLKDVLDALAYAAEKWAMYIPSSGGSPRSGSLRAQSEVDAYYRRRGLQRR